MSDKLDLVRLTTKKRTNCVDGNLFTRIIWTFVDKNLTQNLHPNRL